MQSPLHAFNIYNKVDFYFFAEQLFTPNSVYSGQKLTRLVTTKTPATTNNTIPNVPLITLVKNKIATTIASNIRISRSV